MATEAHFAIGFPEIDDLSVNVEEFDHLGGFVSKRSFNRENLYDHVPCSDPKCHLGGFEIGFMLRSTIRQRKDHVEISGICRGEQGKKGDLDYRRLCLHTFNADVSIRYNNPKTLISIPLNIMTVGANHALKHALIQNAPDSKGTTTFTIGDSKQVADGVTLRYDYEASYHAQEVAEPIYFTIILSLTTGTAGGVIANYIWKNIEPYLPKIRSLSICEKEVKPTKEDVARAFLDEINKLDKEKEQEKS